MKPFGSNPNETGQLPDYVAANPSIIQQIMEYIANLQMPGFRPEAAASPAPTAPVTPVVPDNQPILLPKSVRERFKAPPQLPFIAQPMGPDPMQQIAELLARRGANVAR